MLSVLLLLASEINREISKETKEILTAGTKRWRDLSTYDFAATDSEKKSLRCSFIFQC